MMASATGKWQLVSIRMQPSPPRHWKGAPCRHVTESGVGDKANPTFVLTAACLTDCGCKNFGLQSGGREEGSHDNWLRGTPGVACIAPLPMSLGVCCSHICHVSRSSRRRRPPNPHPMCLNSAPLLQSNLPAKSEHRGEGSSSTCTQYLLVIEGPWCGCRDVDLQGCSILFPGWGIEGTFPEGIWTAQSDMFVTEETCCCLAMVVRDSGRLAPWTAPGTEPITHLIPRPALPSELPNRRPLVRGTVE